MTFSVRFWLGLRLQRLALAVACALALAISHGSAAGAGSVDQLIERLAKGEDFRVRVQAALELGKTKHPDARLPLEKALDDDNAAVRTAAAAALKVLGDKQSIPALEAHKKDSSQAVRTQIQATLASLRMVTSSSVKMIVKMGRMRMGKDVRGKLVGDLESASRQRFGELPGVKVIEESESAEAADKGKKMVMVTGLLRKLNESAEGSEVVYSASVEYVVHRMPEQAIAGTVTGSASTRASKAEAKKRAGELQKLVLAAAVASAVKRAPEALAAATR
ncbi:MAG: HEAT repeat domain-containing protein [Sorangiineae bacterium PRO1]|nr:HEAT repeat domain-containing protein [Sorangiineae bacterium PRO1]